MPQQDVIEFDKEQFNASLRTSYIYMFPGQLVLRD